jgi:AraC-like DNA-binding protein
VTLNIQEITLLFIGFQSLMFAIILLSNRGPKQVSNSLLATFLIVLGAQMFVILSERFAVEYDKVMPYLCLFGFAYGPLLYLYTQSLIYKSFELNKKTLLHVIPALIMLISALLGFGFCSRFGSLLYISLIVYSSISIRNIIQYRKVVKNTQSSIFQMNLSWLQWTLIVFTVTLLTDIYQHFYDEIELIPGLSLVNISLLILINGMFYKGLKQPMIFQGISEEDEHLTDAKTSVDEDPELLNSDLEKIKNYMLEETPFKDAGLTLNQLAEQLNFNSRRLSQLINRNFDQTFMDFINSHRINLAKQRLASPIDPKETIMEVMYEVGFNSKSSFNTLFRQKTGSTPSDFKKQEKQSI